MSRAEQSLSLLLRIEAAIVFCALPAIVMPTAWMAAIHEALGMGDLPRGPIVEYLTRSLSMLYVGWAPLLWVMASDPRRYLPLVRIFAWLSVLAGVTFLVLDVLIEMPLLWIVSETIVVLGFGLLTLWLVWLVQQEENRDVSAQVAKTSRS